MSRATTPPLSWTTTVNNASIVQYVGRIVIKVHDQSLVIDLDTPAEDIEALDNLHRALSKVLGK